VTIMFSVQNCNFIADMKNIVFSTKIRNTERFLLIQNHIKVASMGNITETMDQQKEIR